MLFIFSISTDILWLLWFFHKQCINILYPVTPIFLLIFEKYTCLILIWQTIIRYLLFFLHFRYNFTFISPNVVCMKNPETLFSRQNFQFFNCLYLKNKHTDLYLFFHNFDVFHIIYWKRLHLWKCYFELHQRTSFSSPAYVLNMPCDSMFWFLQIRQGYKNIF